MDSAVGIVVANDAMSRLCNFGLCSTWSSRCRNVGRDGHSIDRTMATRSLDSIVVNQIEMNRMHLKSNVVQILFRSKRRKAAESSNHLTLLNLLKQPNLLTVPTLLTRTQIAKSIKIIRLS